MDSKLVAAVGAIKPMFIGGEWVTETDQPLKSVNPATGQVNFEVATANPQQVDEAVLAGKHAAARPEWRFMLPHVRARILSRIADGMEASAEELARLQMIENGKVWSECVSQVGSAAATFRYYAAVCETSGAELTPPRGDYLAMTAYEPYGVVAAITPWNSPLTMEAQKVAPALAAGNAVMLKPSEVTPSVGLALARIAQEAGLPKGILSVLPGLGSSTGKALIEHPDVRMVSFTGGTMTGRHIAGVAAQRLIPVALELGGKSPHIIFKDANLDAAIEGVVAGIFEGSGQSCVAGSRLFVERAVLDTVVDKLLRRIRSIRVDLPDAPGAQMGPVSSLAHQARVAHMVQRAREDGGEILIGGRAPDEQHLSAGSYFLPTLITGLDNQAQTVREEIFGPVLCVLAFDNEDDLVQQANDSAYGLAAGIWTANYQRAWRVARALEVGHVWINSYKNLSIASPFGGMKESGIGREKGVTGIRLYQQSKAVLWSLNAGNLA